MFKNLKKIVLGLTLTLASTNLEAITQEEIRVAINSGREIPMNSITNESDVINLIAVLRSKHIDILISKKHICSLKNHLAIGRKVARVIVLLISFLCAHALTELASEIIVRLRKINPEKNTPGFKGFCKDLYKRLVWLEKGSLTSKASAGKLMGKIAFTGLIWYSFD